MKKTYINPEMKLSVFETENIVTASGDLKASDYIETHKNEIWGENADSLTKVIVF